MDWIHQYFYTPINILLAVRGSSDFVLSFIFWAVAIKTGWEIQKYRRNGLMYKIRAMSFSFASKHVVAAMLNFNGIVRTIPGWPPEITFTLLVIDIGVLCWLGVTMYRLTHEILMEDEDEQPGDLSTS